MSYTQKTLKTLFGRATGCAFPTCEAPIIDEDTNVVICEICHIKSRRPAGPRHDPNQTSSERDDYDNLIIMCAIHHKIIDSDAISYPVERLLVLKEEHEKSVSSVIAKDQTTFLDSLDERIQLIIAHEKTREGQNDTANAFSKARYLAVNHIHGHKKDRWRASSEGLNQIITAVNEIFTSLEKRHQDERDTVFEPLGIELFKKKWFRSVFNKDFISQISLDGFEEGRTSYVSSEIHLKAEVYSKRPYEFDSTRCYTDLISIDSYYPDLSASDDIVWKNGDLPGLSADALVEKVFGNLVEQIEKGPRVREVYYHYDQTDDGDDSPFIY